VTWREYFSGGREYYYNVRQYLFVFAGILLKDPFQTSMKKSTWDIHELLLLLEKVEKESNPMCVYCFFCCTTLPVEEGPTMHDSPVHRILPPLIS
jgi:hypothetical protein